MTLAELAGRIFPDAPSRILFRLDAGRVPGLSYGHLMRCHRLARAARTAWGARCLFLMRRTDEGASVAKSLGEEVTRLATPDAMEPFLAGPGALVVDLPTGDAALLRRAGQAGLRTVLLDDGRGCDEPVDVALNYGVLAGPNLYPGARRLLLGPQYCILDEAFEGRVHAPAGGPACRVLVTFGGSDPAGLTAKVVPALESSGLPLLATVVLGPGFAGTPAGQPDTAMIRFLRNPPSLVEAMATCDIAVAAGGLSLYELRALRVPTIAIASIAHEAAVIEAFAHRGELLAGLPAWDAARFAAVLADAVKACLESSRKTDRQIR